MWKKKWVKPYIIVIKMRLRLFGYGVRVRIHAGNNEHFEQRLQFPMRPHRKNHLALVTIAGSSACRFWDLFFFHFFPLPIFYVFVGLRSLIFIITFNGVGKKMLLFSPCFSCVSFRFILIRSLSLSLVSNANFAESLNTRNANARSAEPHPHLVCI